MANNPAYQPKRGYRAQGTAKDWIEWIPSNTEAIQNPPEAIKTIGAGKFLVKSASGRILPCESTSEGDTYHPIGPAMILVSDPSEPNYVTPNTMRFFLLW